MTATHHAAWRRLLPLTCATLLLSVGLWLLVPHGRALHALSGGQLVLAWALLAAGFLSSELTQAHIEVRRQTLSVSLSEAPLVLGLFLLDPFALLALRLLAAVVAALWRRTAVYKSAFNLALFSAEIALATAVFTLVRDEATRGPQAWTATYAATLVAAALTGCLVYLAIVRLQGAVPHSAVLSMLLPLVAGAVLPTTGALLAVIVAQSDARAVPLFSLFVVLAVLAYNAYSRLLRRYRTVGQMSAYTEALDSCDTVEELAEQVVLHARTLLASGRAELVLDPTRRRTGVEVVSNGSTRERPAEVDEVNATVRRTGRGVVLPRGSARAASTRWLREDYVRDGVVVPVVGPQGAVMGTLAVAQREGEMATFGGADLELLQMVAHHVEVAVTNRDLVDQLRHDAHHDPLTGLANRVLFDIRLRGAVLGRRRDDTHAVLVLDLDSFTDVNDTMGHQSGDRVLQQVAARLTRSVPEHVTVARLGGDEFALLVPVSQDPDDTVLIAGLVQRALRAPFVIDEVELEIRASVGVARCPEHACDADLLLRHADLAMNVAKAAREAVGVYDPTRDRSDPRRLALVRELRTAIESTQLVCHYQPQVALDGSVVLGAEALVRWSHPSRGMLAPDDFIPVAERTGLIVPLTSLVLRTALTDCARWRAQGRDLQVAVNVSPRGLLAPRFVREVARLLSETGMLASALTLEVTESTVMNDPAKATAVLEQLHELGVQLSVDDFGTGYSSLAYLQRLPVDEVKIDKSFVLELATDPSDLAIVRSIVDLGHNLGLTVVAEGVEDERSRELLDSMDCDVAQGFLVSRPMPVATFESWLDTTVQGGRAVVTERRRQRLVALG